MRTSPLKPYRSLLWLLAAGIFMQTLDTTIVNTALPAMAADLAQSPLRMQSVVVAYVLTVAMLIPASGWLADRFGTRRIFIVAVTVFALGSLACALSPTFNLLIAARVLQGIGGAMLLPIGRLTVLRAVPRKDFLAAISFITVPGLVGPLVGPTLGGWMVEAASWHWIFLINVPLGLAGGLLAMRILPDLRAEVGRFDGLGYALLAFGMMGISLSLEGLSDRSPQHGVLMVLLLFGLAAWVGYGLHAARIQHSLFPLSLFAVPSYRIGVLGNLFARIGAGGMPFLIPLLLQVAMGFSPMQAGMMMIPTAVAAIFMKRLVVRLVQRLGYRRMLVGNTLLVGVMIVSFSLFAPGQPLWLHIMHLSMFGAVNSLQFTAMNTLALRDLEANAASGGNSLLSMVMMLAMSLGVALAGGLLGVFQQAEDAQALLAFRWTFICIGLVTMCAALIFAQLPPTRHVSQDAVERAESS